MSWLYCTQNEAALEKLVVHKPKWVNTDYYGGMLLSSPLVGCCLS